MWAPNGWFETSQQGFGDAAPVALWPRIIPHYAAENRRLPGRHSPVEDCRCPHGNIATVLVKYATGVVKVPIGISEFELDQVMPKDFVSTLPTIAELETELK